MARTATSKNGVATPTTAPTRNAIGATISNAVATPTPTQARPVTAAEGKPAASTAPSAARPATKPTQEQLARRAYEIYLDRCQRGQPGTPQTDWARAEIELGHG